MVWYEGAAETYDGALEMTVSGSLAQGVYGGNGSNGYNSDLTWCCTGRGLWRACKGVILVAEDMVERTPTIMLCM